MNKYGELLRLWNKADESGKQTIHDLLVCMVSGDEETLREIRQGYEARDAGGMRKAIERGARRITSL